MKIRKIRGGGVSGGNFRWGRRLVGLAEGLGERGWAWEVGMGGGGEYSGGVTDRRAARGQGWVRWPISYSLQSAFRPPTWSGRGGRGRGEGRGKKVRRGDGQSRERGEEAEGWGAGMGEEGGKEQGRPRAEDEKERRKDERRREQEVERKVQTIGK